MHVCEVASQLISDVTKHVRTSVHGKKSFTIHLSNSSHVPLTFEQQPVIFRGEEKECRPGFKNLQPSRAGVIYFAAYGDLSAVADLALGGKRILLGLAMGRLVSVPRFVMEWASMNVTVDAFHQRMPKYFCGTQGAPTCACSLPFAAVVTDVHRSHTEIQVHIFLGYIRDLGIERSLSIGKASFAELKVTHPIVYGESNALLQLCRWCYTHEKDVFGSAVFAMELAAVKAGLARLDLVDRAYALNMLVHVFILTNVVVAPLELLDAELRLCRSTAPSAILDPAVWKKYREFRRQNSGDPDGTAAFVDAALTLLNAALLLCMSEMEQAVDCVRDDEATFVKKRSSVTARTMSDGDQSVTSAESFVLEHLSSGLDNSLQDAAGKRKEEVMKSLVRKCVEEACTFQEERDKILEQLAEEADKATVRNALLFYKSNVPGAHRRFAKGRSGHNGTLSTGGNFCCRCLGGATLPRHLMPGGKMVNIEFSGAEVFAGLDQGRVARPRVVLDSLGTRSLPYKTMSTNSKSGEFFFFSGDRRFLVKTVSEAEATLLFRMLPAYQDHMKRIPESLIVRYAGLFAIQVPGIGLTYFTIMSSVFDPKYDIWQTFDIKGSMHGRKRKDKETIGKDWDWLNSPSGPSNLHLSDDMRRRFCATHEQDVEFLSNFNCLDYSMLIGFHRPNADAVADDIHRPTDTTGITTFGIGGGLQSADSTVTYYVGLIDFLIAYHLNKQAEHVLKVAQGVGQSASCVDPRSYAVRQVRFVRDQVVALPAGAEEGVWGTMALLKVQIIAACDLVNADLVQGVSDPYVKVQLGLQERRTRTIRDSLNPRWNETLYFAVDEAHAECNLQLSIWDEDIVALQGTDDFLGECLFPMETVIKSDPVERCLSLQKTDSGTLTFILEYVCKTKRRVKRVEYL